MIVIDVNILIYAVNEDAPLHGKAKAWIEDTLSGTEIVGFPWTVILAFLRLTTRQGLFRSPLPVEMAFAVIEDWLGQPPSTLLEPGPRHFRLLRDLLESAGTGGNLTSDAHLAALALEGGACLSTTDGDFARFPRLRWRNPLA